MKINELKDFIYFKKHHLLYKIEDVMDMMDELTNRYPNYSEDEIEKLIKEVYNVQETDDEDVLNFESITEFIKFKKEIEGNDRKKLYSCYPECLEYFPKCKNSTYERIVRVVCSPGHEDKEIKKEEKQKENNEKVNTKMSDISFKTNYFSSNLNFKRMVVLSDSHCGHYLGLTSPNWQFNELNSELGEISRIQKESWDWYTNSIQNLGNKIDVLITNGDMIDGRSERTGSNELITPDRNNQVSMAIDVINQWDYDKLFMTRGTPYHTGKEEQFEDIIAKLLNASHIEDVLNIQFGGKYFNFRHKVANTSVPYSKATQIAKTAMLNELGSNYHGTSPADVIIRSHVHRYVHYQDSSKYAITTPALQVDSRYGRQQCDGIIDFGYVVIDVYENGYVNIMPILANLGSNKPKVHVV